MQFETNLYLCIFSTAILIAISLSSRTTVENGTVNGKIYMSFLYTTIFLLVADLFSRLDGRTETFYIILNYTGNLFLFLFNPLLPAMWLIYVHNQVFCDDRKTLRFSKPFIAFALVNAVLTVVSQFNGWYYYIDSNNVYHRGALFFIPAASDLAIMLATFAMLIANRKRMERKYYVSLSIFAVPPMICIVLQLFVYGIAFALNGIAISLIIMFINTQNRRMNMDYLTGVFNRKQLDYYIADKIRGSSGLKSFSAILLDLDNFKYINDTLGHNVGDEALKTVVALLKKCIRTSDFIARFGGDEFYIVMDIFEPDRLLEVEERIEKCIGEFNGGSASYKLSLSMGHLIYDVHKPMSVEEFEDQIDKLMYRNKTTNKTTNKTISQQMAY